MGKHRFVVATLESSQGSQCALTCVRVLQPVKVPRVLMPSCMTSARHELEGTAVFGSAVIAVPLIPNMEVGTQKAADLRRRVHFSEKSHLRASVGLS